MIIIIILYEKNEKKLSENLSQKVFNFGKFKNVITHQQNKYIYYIFYMQIYNNYII